MHPKYRKQNTKSHFTEIQNLESLKTEIQAIENQKTESHYTLPDILRNSKTRSTKFPHTQSTKFQNP